MANINKHRFLTELSKFLTFLSDEEREQVLIKFGEIFDAAPVEEELTATLVSPLKVTVELSRAYGRGGIDAALERAVSMSGVDLSAVKEEVPEENPFIQESLFGGSEDAGDSAEAAPAPTEEVPTQKAEPPAAPSSSSDEDDIFASIGSAVEAAFDADEDAMALKPKVDAAPLPVQDFHEEAEPVVEEATQVMFIPKTEPKVEQAPSEDDEVKPYIPPEKKTPEVKPHVPPMKAPAKHVYDDEFIDPEPKEYFEGADLEKEADIDVSYRLKPFALVLFIIVFVPLGLIGALLILAVAAAFLALMVSAAGSGIFAVTLAFSGMTMFADIIMTLGVALVCFALTIVLLWLTIWFLIWAFGGLVRGIIRLGKKWCYKEVAAQ